MGTEMVSETSVIFYQLTWLGAREDFITWEILAMLMENNWVSGSKSKLHRYGGLLSLWLYKDNKLRDWKKSIYSIYSPLSSTHVWLRFYNFIKPSKKNSFGCAANRKIGNRKSRRLISTPTYTRTTSTEIKFVSESFTFSFPAKNLKDWK
jgi:hypothetical protein